MKDVELTPIIPNRDISDSRGLDMDNIYIDERDEESARLLAGSTSSGTTEDKEVMKGKALFYYRVRRVLGFLLASWYKFVILGIVITMIVLVSIHGFSVFGSILDWFKKRNGWGGWGAYVGFYTGIVALFFPGVVFIMGAGFVFGFWRGLLAVWIGGAVGQALAFLLARYLLRDWVESFVHHKWKKWKYIDAALENDGWKLVLIMRLSPIIPYNLLNIAMATTSIHFLSFTIVSAIGIIFECGIFCYIGTIADSITSIVSGQAGKPKAVQWVLLGLSIMMGVIGAIFVSIMVRRAIKKADELSSLDDESASHDRLDSLTATLSPERQFYNSSRGWGTPYANNFPDIERGHVEKVKTSPRTRSSNSLTGESTLEEISPLPYHSIGAGKRKSRTHSADSSLQ